MKRALAVGLLSFALAAYAQAPPEPPSPGETQPAAPAPESASPSNPPVSEAPPAETTPSPAQAAQPRPAKPAAPKTPRALPPAPAAEASPRDAQMAALRGEVSRLQSELDAERAAALAAPEDSASGAQPARSPWGWLIATALLALVAGFLLGWRLLDRRIRARYGGLRIY